VETKINFLDQKNSDDALSDYQVLKALLHAVTNSCKVATCNIYSLGGVMVSCSPLNPRFTGSNPAEEMDF
jgi:hypothetical protein